MLLPLTGRLPVMEQIFAMTSNLYSLKREEITDGQVGCKRKLGFLFGNLDYLWFLSRP